VVQHEIPLVQFRKGQRKDTVMAEHLGKFHNDPVVSKHIARFLGRSLQNVKSSEKLATLVGAGSGTEALIPTAVLFNGGVFKAAAIRARVLDLHSVPPSMGVTAPLAGAFASKPARRGPITSVWRPRCPPFRATSRRSRHCALSRRACRKARNC
jgi:hypothetical protein